MRLIRTFLLGIVFIVVLLIVISFICQSVFIFMIAIIISSPFLMILALFIIALICASAAFNKESRTEWEEDY